MVIQLFRDIMNGELDAVWKMLETLGIVLKHEEKEKRLKDLFKCVSQMWIKTAMALPEMIILKILSTKRVQSYKATML